MRINHLGIEVTRRCNIKCEHCIRGYAQNMDISFEDIDILLDKTTSIGHFCPTGGEPSLNIPAIQYFIDGCRKRNIPLEGFYISTNGIDITERFIDICIDLYELCDNKSKCSVQISNDKYHLKQRKYNDELLLCLPFYTKRYRENSDMKGTMVYEGMAAKNDIEIAIRRFKQAKYQLYLNAKGDVIDGDCWSYESQEKHKICSVKNLVGFYMYLNQQKMNKVEEDWERLDKLDIMYLVERDREIMKEYLEWKSQEDEKVQRKAAIIEVVMELKKEKQHDRG